MNQKHAQQNAVHDTACDGLVGKEETNEQRRCERRKLLQAAIDRKRACVRVRLRASG